MKIFTYFLGYTKDKEQRGNSTCKYQDQIVFQKAIMPCRELDNLRLNLANSHDISKFLRFFLNQQEEKLVKIGLMRIILGFGLLGENIDFIKYVKMSDFGYADSLDCFCFL